MKKIAVIGAGYVGLVTGACLAQKNNHVIIVENNHDRIKALLKGEIPFYEPGLDKLVSSAIANNTIIFVDHIKKALEQNPEIIFSCVGTPSQDDGSADLSYVWNVAKEIGQHISQYTLIINKSTVPVGTAHKVKHIIQHELITRNLTFKFDVASNPEFLKEGDALNDFLTPDRVVVGVESSYAKQLLKELYAPFLTTSDQLVVMDIASAELTKYAANAMLATRISFMNEIALLADKVGADVEQIKKGISLDKRIGSHFLNAGIGYGGSCFPKDVKALIHTGKEYKQPMTLIEQVDEANTSIRKIFINTILSTYKDSIANKTFAVWGLAFKPETDDIRCAPSIDVINALLQANATIKAYDPVAQENIKQVFGNTITYCSSPSEALKNSDALIVLTEWKTFKEFSLEDLAVLKDKIIFDGRNCWNPQTITALGLTYITMGRNNACKQKQQVTQTKEQKYTTAQM